MGTKIYKHQVQSTGMKRASIDGASSRRVCFFCLFIDLMENQNITIQIAS